MDDGKGEWGIQIANVYLSLFPLLGLWIGLFSRIPLVYVSFLSSCSILPSLLAKRSGEKVASSFFLRSGS